MIIKGSVYETLEDLASDITDPAVGDQYNVGTTPPYNVYRWTGSAWEDQGGIGVSIKDIDTHDIDDIVDGETISDKANKYLGIDGLSYYNTSKLVPLFATKVDKVTGKGLSTNDFTTELMNQITTNKNNIASLSTNKVDKVTGKGLSSNDFTTAYRTKIDVNGNNITTLTTNKLNKAFNNFSALASSSFDDGLFAVYYNGEVYKLAGSDLVDYVAASPNIVLKSDIADMTEVKVYLGIN